MLENLLFLQVLEFGFVGLEPVQGNWLGFGNLVIVRFVDDHPFLAGFVPMPFPVAQTALRKVAVTAGGVLGTYWTF